MTTETKTQPTPGPWTAKEYQGDGVLGVFGPTHADGSDYAPIVHFLNRGGIDLANARLIAAAPELLEACKAVADSHYASNREMERVGFRRNKLPRSSLLCLAAIAKAEGREP